MHAIYQASDYRAYLEAELDSERFGRGARAQLALYLGVQNSFISQVLSGKQNLTPEQSIKVADFLGHAEREREYFLLLVSYERSGSVELKRFYKKQIDRRLATLKEIRNRVVRGEKRKLKEDELAEYYDSWYVPAIHMLLRNPKISEPKQISEALSLDLKLVRKSLETLEKLQFIEKTRAGWKSIQPALHVGSQSRVQRQSHSNWRLKALQSLSAPLEQDLHYTGVMSIDSRSAFKIRDALLKLLEEIDPTIYEAQDEEVYTICLDLFKVA